MTALPRHSTPTALFRRIPDTVPTMLENCPNIRRNTVRIKIGTVSDLIPVHCPNKIGTLSELPRNTHYHSQGFDVLEMRNICLSFRCGNQFSIENEIMSENNHLPSCGFSYKSVHIRFPDAMVQ